MNLPIGKFVVTGESFGPADKNADYFPVPHGKSIKDTATFAMTSLDSSPKDNVN
jgi:hypothetical protein